MTSNVKITAEHVMVPSDTTKECLLQVSRQGYSGVLKVMKEGDTYVDCLWDGAPLVITEIMQDKPID